MDMVDELSFISPGKDHLRGKNFAFLTVFLRPLQILNFILFIYIFDDRLPVYTCHYMWHPISSALGFRHVKLTRFINACYRPSSDYANPVKAISFESLPENYKRIEFPRFLFFLQNIFVFKFFLYVFPFHESCLRQLFSTKQKPYLWHPWFIMPEKCRTLTKYGLS